MDCIFQKPRSLEAEMDLQTVVDVESAGACSRGGFILLGGLEGSESLHGGGDPRAEPAAFRGEHMV